MYNVGNCIKLLKNKGIFYIIVAILKSTKKVDKIYKSNAFITKNMN